MRYAIVIEKAGSNYSAYVPDLPGCVATGASLEEVDHEIRAAIVFHLEGLRCLEEPEPEALQAWAGELERRSREVAEGKVQPISWELARTHLQAELTARSGAQP